MSDFSTLLLLLYNRVKEEKKPLTINELVEGLGKYEWTRNKVYKIVAKAYHMKILGRILVDNNRYKHGRRVYSYYPTKQYEIYKSGCIKRRLNNDQLENVPDELKQVLK